MSERVLLGLVTIVALGVSAQWLAWRLRAPAILFLLLFGILAGPVARMVPADTAAGQVLAPFVVHPGEMLGAALEPFVALSVAVILFEGGLSLKLAELREVGSVVRNLVSIGVVITWLLTTAAAVFILQLQFRLAVFVGALLVVSGPTVVGPLLRQIRPSARVASILKWESIVIDPIGVVLAVLVYHVAFAGEGTEVVLELGRTVLFGGGIGIASAVLLTYLFHRFWVPDTLDTAVVLMFVFISFTAANALQDESGLLAVTLMGVVLANQTYVAIEHIMAFKENLRVLLLGVLFIVLAARLPLEDLGRLGLMGLVFLAFMILVVRPVAVFASSFRSGLNWREKVFVAWLAPRGIVAASTASVFSLYLQQARDGRPACDQAEYLVPITFGVIIGTVTVYGLTAGRLARRLGLAERDPQGALIVGAGDLARAIGRVLHEQGFRVLLLDDHHNRVAAARLEGLPALVGTVHQDQLLEELDLAGIGRLLALTPSDPVNVLAVHRFRAVFGRRHVYQLPLEHAPGGKGHASRNLHGRTLFGPDLTCQVLEQRLRDGATLKATSLTSAFTYKDLDVHFAGNAVPLFVITQARQLKVVIAGQAVEPQPGHTVISLVLPTGNGTASV